MIPQKLILKESLPKNQNGKIDRRLLSTEFETVFQAGFEQWEQEQEIKQIEAKVKFKPCDFILQLLIEGEKLIGVHCGRGQDSIISPSVQAVAANHSLLLPPR